MVQYILEHYDSQAQESVLTGAPFAKLAYATHEAQRRANRAVVGDIYAVLRINGRKIVQVPVFEAEGIKEY